MTGEMAEETHRSPTPAPYPHCYRCGSENPTGLHLELEFDGQELHSEFTPLDQDQHGGYPGIVHGGVISSFPYEVMANIRSYSSDEALLCLHGGVPRTGTGRESRYL